MPCERCERQLIGCTALLEIFRDSGWPTLTTSNCGNPVLRLFDFGPVATEGHGFGYIIKNDELSMCGDSKHLQARRFLATLQGHRKGTQRILVALVRAANERP